MSKGIKNSCSELIERLRAKDRDGYSELFGLAADALEAAASRERELEARVAALRAYVDHKADCAYFHFVAPRRCTCGLDAAMAGEK